MANQHPPSAENYLFKIENSTVYGFYPCSYYIMLLKVTILTDQKIGTLSKIKKTFQNYLRAQCVVDK